jgi:hypothetical protein
LLPTDIDASSAPAYLARLRSGLVAMAWNRFYPEGLSAEEKARFPLRGGDRNLSERATSWYRGEVSLALSEDDGQTWTRPQVVMRCASRGLSYPFILERRPGLLWLMTRFNYRVAITLREQEFVGPASAPPWA